MTALLVHLPTNGRYGYFRDELYYIACARHLDFQQPLGDALRSANAYFSLSRFERQRSRTLAAREEVAVSHDRLTPTLVSNR